MSSNDRVLELLRRAVAILEQDTPEPTPLKTFQPSEDEVVLEGAVGRPELRLVGSDNIPLLTFGLKVRTPEGPETWVKAQAWRRVAEWAGANLASGEVVQVVGKWETSIYNGKETPFFSVRLFSTL